MQLIQRKSLCQSGACKMEPYGRYRNRNPNDNAHVAFQVGQAYIMAEYKVTDDFTYRRDSATVVERTERNRRPPAWVAGPAVYSTI